MPAPTRLVLAGSGRVAKARLRELRTREDALVVGLAASDPARAQAELGVEATSDWTALVERSDVDAIMVCTRNERHADVARHALQAGKHVSVDYPLALSLVDVEELAALAQRHGRVLHVEHIELFSPWFLGFATALPRVGTLLSLRWTDWSARQAKPGDWTFSLDSGFSLFAGASVLSRLIWLAGPAEVSSAAERLDGLVERRYVRRHTTAHLRFANNVAGFVDDAVGLAVPGPSSRLEALGSEGLLVAEDRRSVTLTTRDSTEAIPLPETPGLFGQDIDSFLAQVRTGKVPYVTLDHELSIARTAEAAQRLCANRLERSTVR